MLRKSSMLTLIINHEHAKIKVTAYEIVAQKKLKFFKIILDYNH